MKSSRFFQLAVFVILSVGLVQFPVTGVPAQTTEENTESTIGSSPAPTLPQETQVAAGHQAQVEVPPESTTPIAPVLPEANPNAPVATAAPQGEISAEVGDPEAVATAAAESITGEDQETEWGAKIHQKVQANFTDEDIVSYGKPVTIAADQVVDGDVVSFGGPITVLGVVKGSVVSIGGPITVSGVIHEDVVSTGGSVTLAASAQVSGDVVSMGGKLTKDAGASIKGDEVELSNKFVDSIFKYVHPKILKRAQIDIEDVDPEESGWGASIFSFIIKLLWLIGSLGFGVLVLLLFPRNIIDVSSRIRIEPLRSFAYGLLSYVVVILVSFVLIFTCLGIPISIILLVFFCVTIAFGLVSGFYAVGESLIHLFRKGMVNPLFAVIAGMLVMGLILFIPFFVGVTIWFLFSIFAVGATIMTRYGTNKPWFGGNGSRSRELDLTPPMDEPPVGQQ